MIDSRDLAREVGRWDWAAGSERALMRRWPNTFIRDVYVKGAHRDIANAATLGGGLSIDRAHSPVLDSRVRAGGARPLAGPRAFELQLPRNFGWTDVADLRKDRGVREYAAVMRDVEQTAQDEAVSIADLERLIRDRYWRRVAEAERHGPGRWAKYGITGIGFAAGEIATAALTGIPVAGGAIGSVVGHGTGEVAERVFRPRWLSVHTKLLRRGDAEWRTSDRGAVR